MPIRKFSVSKVHYPKFGTSIEFNEYDCYSKRLNESYSTIHYFELIELNGPQVLGYNPSKILLENQYLILENVRPELFIRRDFIKKFILGGIVRIDSPDRFKNFDYAISCKDSKISIIAKTEAFKKLGLEHSGKFELNSILYYEVNVDLSDKRLLESNLYHDKTVAKFKRLPPLKKIYFKCYSQTLQPILNDGNDFFNSVIKEYEIDGFKPVPISGCQLKNNEIISQIDSTIKQVPDLSFLTDQDLHNEECASRIVLDLIDWIGFQILNIDCKQDRLRAIFETSDDVEAHIRLSSFTYNHVEGYFTDVDLESLFQSSFFNGRVKEEISRNIIAKGILLKSHKDQKLSGTNFIHMDFKNFVVFLQVSKKCVIKLKSDSLN